MVVQHNIPALNAHRTLGINNAGTSKNLEKLSSGFRINRAADDAAGLAISEKMRGQISGLAMAEQNTLNGISLIQTAEGGLNETHSILQRMRELSVQASNGTYQDEDRDQITLEFEALKSEVTRIADSTHYNGIKLLDGSLGRDLQGAAGTAATNGTAINAATITAAFGGTPTATGGTFTAAGTLEFYLNDRDEVSVRGLTNVNASLVGGKLKLVDSADATKSTLTANALDLTRIKNMLKSTDDGKLAMINSNAGVLTGAAAGPVSVTQSAHTGFGAMGLTVAFDNANAKYGEIDFSIEKATNGEYMIKVNGDSQKVNMAQLNAGVKMGGLEIKVDAAAAGAENNFKTAINDGGIFAEKIQVKDLGTGTTAANSLLLDYTNATVSSGAGLIFQIGANGGADQKVGLNVANMDSFNIGLKKGDTWADGTVLAADAMLANASVATIDDANKAIDIITASTNMVSSQRAELGALQNRMEHTSNNLGVTKENLTAAESIIRDVDMAKEMMNFTKNNILMQANQAMLAQANQLPQGVLQLLR